MTNVKVVPFTSSYLKNMNSEKYTLEMNVKMLAGSVTVSMKTVQSTDGNKSYNRTLAPGYRRDEINLRDEAQKKSWDIDGIKGTYTVTDWSKYPTKPDDDDDTVIKDFTKYKIMQGYYKIGSTEYPADCIAFTETENGVPVTVAMIYCFNGSKPKYMIVKGIAEVQGDTAVQTVMEGQITRCDTYADANYMNFEKILSQYKLVEDDD